MRIGLMAVAMLCSVSNIAFSQQWQTAVSVNSRVGYTSNTYLNPYFSEWDRTVEGGYGTLTTLGQAIWFDNNNEVEMTGGLVFEPFLGDRTSWNGGLALANYRYKFNNRISAGVETGGSYFSSDFKRTLFWAQPTLSWFPGLFTNIKLKVGSNFRRYDDFVIDSVSIDSRNRIDLYALEVETWPSFRWQLTAGLYGNLDNLPAIGEGFSSVATVSHIFSGGERIRLVLGLDRYQNQITTTTGGGGFPPGGTTESIRQTDQLMRLGLEGSFPVNNRISLFLDLTGLQYQSDATTNNLNDYQVSGGVRLNFRPGRSGGRSGIIPEWDKNSGRQEIQIRYAGEGQLYLIGDFNNWKRPGIPLVEQAENRYVAQLDLEEGAYEYKVLQVQGGEEEWISFSEETYTVDDGFGGTNAMILIEQ